MTFDVSVVVPLFNKAAHVIATLTTALNQTLPPREVIVVDDGSTDGGLELVRDLARSDPRILVFCRSEPGPGGYAARNLGVDRASGEWIAFLDADDRWRPDHLASLAIAVEACPSPVSGVFGRYEARWAERSKLIAVDETRLRPGVALNMTTIVKAWLSAGPCPMWTGAVAFRRDVLLAAGLFPAGKALRGGDKDLWLRAIAAGPTAFSPKVTAEFHQDTVNRVTTGTGHTLLPILCSTIATLLPHCTPPERHALRALSNEQVRQYARYSVGGGYPVGRKFLNAIYQPQGITVTLRIIGYMAASKALKLSRLAAVRRYPGGA